MNLGLVGKVALVTGSSRGIGRAIALALASEECKLALCARSAEPLERALEEVRTTGVEAIAEIADVRSARDAGGARRPSLRFPRPPPDSARRGGR